MMSRDTELVVLSHLRWTFVWQRPQHLISRVGAGYQKTWFVEEPLPGDGPEPVLRTEDCGQVTRVWLELPAGRTPAGYDEHALPLYEKLVPQLLGDSAGPGSARTVWLYTPMALDVARALNPTCLVYDVMDDLAAFKFAPPALVLRQRQALREADIVFTGGRSLHRGVADRRPDAHCFPSGVEPEHYAPAIKERARRSHATPVAGYVGVIDERLDLDLIAGLADELPQWEVRIVGPVVKIDQADLPQRPNIVYPGPKQYAELPSVMAGFDVALMPFALNEATRSISPTKTLEYLAAGLPVVSTRVPDVVTDYTGLVHLCEGAAEFAECCRAAVAECHHARAERVRPILRKQHWDAIAGRMADLLDGLAANRETA